MKALVGTFNLEKALVGAFSVIVKTGCGTDGALHSYTALAQYLPDSVGVSALPHGRVVLEGLAGVELAGGVVQVRELHHLAHNLLSSLVLSGFQS